MNLKKMKDDSEFKLNEINFFQIHLTYLCILIINQNKIEPFSDKFKKLYKSL